MRKTYRLYSSGAIWAPGILAVMQKAYADGADRKYLYSIFRKTWAMPAKLADALLAGRHPYTITDTDEVLVTG